MSEQNKNIHTDRSKQEKDEADNPMDNVAPNASVDQRQRHVDVTAMIRSLQRTEGVADCFRRGLTECQRPDCAWRKYCFGNPDNTPFKNDT